MSTKKYVSKLFLKHSTFVILKDGRKVNLEFTGGIGGTYKTGGHILITDPEVQEAIESDKRFNVEFRLMQTYPDNVPVAKQPMLKIDKPKNFVPVETVEVIEVEPESESEPIIPEEVEPEPEEVEPETGYTNVDSVTDPQLARNYFRDLGETSMTPVLGKAKIKILCDKYKVNFPNLK